MPLTSMVIYWVSDFCYLDFLSYCTIRAAAPDSATVTQEFELMNMLRDWVLETSREFLQYDPNCRSVSMLRASDGVFIGLLESAGLDRRRALLPIYGLQFLVNHSFH